MWVLQLHCLQQLNISTSPGQWTKTSSQNSRLLTRLNTAGKKEEAPKKQHGDIKDPKPFSSTAINSSMNKSVNKSSSTNSQLSTDCSSMSRLLNLVCNSALICDIRETENTFLDPQVPFPPETINAKPPSDFNLQHPLPVSTEVTDTPREKITPIRRFWKRKKGCHMTHRPHLS